LPGTHKGTSLLQPNELLCAAGEKCGLTSTCGNLAIYSKERIQPSPLTPHLIKELSLSSIAALPLIVRLLY